MKVCIIGLGLIGGSMAIDLKKRGFTEHIIGVDADKLHAHTAERLGLADEIATLEEGIKKSDLILVATPANASLNLLPKILDLITHQVVTDVCSIKKNICNRIKNHTKRGQYVAAHPMAGTEHTGPWAAIPNLFDGKAVIIAESEDSSARALALVKKIYKLLNMHMVYMSAHHHDIHAAYVSHISHISSFALALTVLEKEKNEKNIFEMASGGFDSTVRLAKSSAEMWTPIFEQNSENITAVLDHYIDQLKEFREHITQGNSNLISQKINQANHIKRVLGG